MSVIKSFGVDKRFRCTNGKLLFLSGISLNSSVSLPALLHVYGGEGYSFLYSNKSAPIGPQIKASEIEQAFKKWIWVRPKYPDPNWEARSAVQQFWYKSGS